MIKLERPKFITSRRRLNQLWIKKGGDGLSMKASHKLACTAWFNTICRKLYCCLSKALWLGWKHSQELRQTWFSSGSQSSQDCYVLLCIFRYIYIFFFWWPYFIVQRQFSFFSRRKAGFLSPDSTLRLATFLMFLWRCTKGLRDWPGTQCCLSCVHIWITAPSSCWNFPNWSKFSEVPIQCHEYVDSFLQD